MVVIVVVQRPLTLVPPPSIPSLRYVGGPDLTLDLAPGTLDLTSAGTFDV